jgi:putative transferase (TIGR04331 family)
LKSLGKIQLIKLPTIPISPKHTSHDMRVELTKFDNDFDDLDKFIFSTLYHLMPTSFLENFDQYYVGYKKHFGKMKKLKWVVCEDWIGHESSSMALAILKTLDVKHICNEHNYISHPFIGNSLKYQIPLVDEFISLGWSDNRYPNFVPGASMFEWDNGIKYKKEYDILLVLGASGSRSPETNAGYADYGPYGARSYAKMTKDFLQALGDKTLSQVYVRSYPKYSQKNWQVWDQKFLFSEYIDKIINFDDYSRSGRELIGKARLVVVNYLSTSHLESIISDIPTIFLWNKETYHHEDKYASFYDGLIDSGICQTNPLSAANFINKIKGNPQLWWDSEAVQKSRKSFLKENFGEPDILFNYLIKKSDIKNV